MEFIIAWSVYEVNLMVMPLTWRHAQLNSYITFNFFRFKVHNMFIILTFTYEINRTRS